MKDLIIYLVLILVLFIETKIPFQPLPRNRWQGIMNNIGIKLFNIILIYVLYQAGLKAIFKSDTSFGLLNLLELPIVIEFLIAILIFDLTFYGFHILYHRVPLLWRFHKVHHSDISLNGSTAFRSHFGIYIFAALVQGLVVMPLFGITLIQLLLINTILVSIQIFHHSNISLPNNIDKLIRLIIVSPNMHRVHHSMAINELNTNFGNIFSFWDKLFKTYHEKKDIEKIQFGVKELDKSSYETFRGILMTPFQKT